MSDLHEWLKHSKATRHADDTKTSASAKLLDVVISQLKEDSIYVLKCMASNGLVANPSKAALLMLNVKKQLPIEIKIGKEMVI